MLNSIKPICDWTVRFTASSDERLACITQTSFHSTTSFMNPFLATMAQNWIIVNSLLTYTTGPLTFLFHLIVHTTTEHCLFFVYSSSNLLLPTLISTVHTQWTTSTENVTINISPVGDWRSTSLEWPWPWFRPYGIPSCITHRPVPIPNFIEIKETFCGRTYGRKCFPPLILLGRLLEVDLIIQYAVNSISRHQITDRLTWFWYNCKVLTCGAKERSLDCLAVTSADVAVVDTSAGSPVDTDCVTDWLVDVSSDQVVKTAHHYSRKKTFSFPFSIISCHANLLCCVASETASTYLCLCKGRWPQWHLR